MSDNTDDDVDTYLVEAEEFFCAKPSRYAPHLNGGVCHPAPMGEVCGPESEYVFLDPVQYKAFAAKLSPEQAESFRADSQHNHILRWTARVAYPYAACTKGARWEDLSPTDRYNFCRAALFIERCLFTHGIGDHLRRISPFEEAIGVTTAFKLIYAGLVWGKVMEPV